MAGVDAAVGDVHQVGQGADAGAGLPGLGDDLPSPGPGGRGQGQQDLVGRQFAHRGGHVRGGEDRASVQHLADQRGIVVEEADHDHLAALSQGAGQLPPGRARAIDHHAPPGRSVRGLEPEQPGARQHPRGRHADEQQDRLDQGQGARDARHPHHQEHQGEGQGVDRAGPADGEDPAHGELAVDLAVEAQHPEDRQGQQDRDAHQLGVGRVALGQEAQPQEDRDQAGGGAEPRIGRQDDAALDGPRPGGGEPRQGVLGS